MPPTVGLEPGLPLQVLQQQASQQPRQYYSQAWVAEESKTGLHPWQHRHRHHHWLPIQEPPGRLERQQSLHPAAAAAVVCW